MYWWERGLLEIGDAIDGRQQHKGCTVCTRQFKGENISPAHSCIKETWYEIENNACQEEKP